MKFSDLKVHKDIVRALEDYEIVEPTHIQQEAIPVIKSGKDIVGMSKTGSGKTIAFALPIIERIVPGEGPQILVMAPIRELAVQIAKEIKKYSKYLKVSVATVYGGVSLNPQIDKMSRSEVIVATPGRTLDHLQRDNVQLDRLKCVVLDEADKMVDMGFMEDVDKILQATPKDKQVCLFGATISEEINRLKQRHMRGPVTVKSDAHVKEEFLKQFYYDVKPHEKFSLLVHLLKTENLDSAIIFCAKRTTVDTITKNLRHQNIKAEMIHGKLSQNRRLKVMENFKKGRPSILVASAVAARGMDIDNVTHVFNYDLSQDPEEYIHRIGRTARAGEKGKAITLLGPDDHGSMGRIMRDYDVKLESLDLPKFKRLKFIVNRRNDRRGGFRNKGSRRGFRSRGPGRNFSNKKGSWNRRDSTSKRDFNSRPKGNFHKPRPAMNENAQMAGILGNEDVGNNDWRE